jgi:hypothetical protein
MEWHWQEGVQVEDAPSSVYRHFEVPLGCGFGLAPIWWAMKLESAEISRSVTEVQAAQCVSSWVIISQARAWQAN